MCPDVALGGPVFKVIRFNEVFWLQLLPYEKYHITHIYKMAIFDPDFQESQEGSQSESGPKLLSIYGPLQSNIQSPKIN